MTTLDALVGDVQAVFFDFDGPICNLFAGYAASDIAERLRELLRSKGADLPEALLSVRDPLEVLRWTGSVWPDLMDGIEAAQVEAEHIAVKAASPTNGSREAVFAVAQSGRPAVIVSNNSVDAISVYLRDHGLAEHVTSVVGRIPSRPDLMKPNPESLYRAAESVGVPVTSCLLIGDSVTDIQAAKKAGALSVGYGKHERRSVELDQAGADVIVFNMTDLARVFRENPRS